MTSFWTEPWFGWVLAVALGLPLALVVLTEIIGSLVRRGHPAAKPLRLLRNLVLPTGAVLALLVLANESRTDLTWVRLVATLFGFLLILLVLSAFNVALFGSPKAGTWRDRLPSIFIDIARLLLILTGLAVLFSWVWGADVGGLFAALGVTSIVLGLALQGAIGAVVSGLLLLFEQPFRLGDWLETPVARGRVVEVNWRSVHIETGTGVQIVPNATLAAASFTNLSRTPGPYRATVVVGFSVDDPPAEVLALLRQVAGDLPVVDPAAAPSVSFNGKGEYTVSVPVLGPAAVDHAVALFSMWLWYAARRSGLTLDGGSVGTDAPETVRSALEAAARSLRLPGDEIEPLLPFCRIERFGAGEIVQRAGEVADAVRVLLSGRAEYGVVVDDVPVPIAALERGEYIGQTALTHERSLGRAIALTPLEVLAIDPDALERLANRHPPLAKEIGQAIDRRRAAARTALAQGREGARRPDAFSSRERTTP
jgi:small-conductance mechanosensitive channel/CRP-like cAMP-binding protein